MLHRTGPFDEEALIEALKEYLPQYGMKEREECRIPYKDNGVKKYAVFLWMAKQWVYTESKPK